MQKKKNEGEELYGELGKAFNFTQGDLEVNRAGFISARQKKLLNKRFLLIPLAGFGYLLFQLLLILIFAQTNAETVGFITALGIVVVPALSILYLNEYYILWRESKTGKVKSFVGKTSFERWRKPPYMMLEFEGKLGLGLSAAQYNLLKNGNKYIVYCFPNSRNILSIEESH